jgi:hypothetical protein
MEKTLLCVLIFSISTQIEIYAQIDKYFYLNETMDADYYEITASSFSQLTWTYSGFGVIGDTVVAGKKYFKLSKPFNLTFFRYGSDDKLYFLNSGVEKLFLDFSDTTSVTFQGFLPPSNELVNINRSCSVNGDELQFSINIPFSSQNFTFKKNLGLIRYHSSSFSITGHGASYTLELQEMSVSDSNGSIKQFTSNVSPKIISQDISLFNDTSFIIRVKVEHDYSPYKDKFNTPTPYINKCGVEYRFLKGSDTSALRKFEVENTLADSLNLFIKIDSNLVRNGYNLLYSVYAASKKPIVRTRYVPFKGGFYGFTYINPDTSYAKILVNSKFCYVKYKFKPGEDPVPVALDSMEVIKDTAITGEVYRKYILNKNPIYVKYDLSSAVANYYSPFNGSLKFSGRDSLQKYVNNTGKFWRMPIVALSFKEEYQSTLYGYNSNIRKYATSDGKEFLLTQEGVGPLQFQYRETSSGEEIYSLYKVYKIMRDGKLIYNKPAGFTPLIPQRLTLYQNYPNPFNNGTVIKFYAKQAGTASLHIYDIQGSMVYKSSLEIDGEGDYHFRITEPTLPSGVYLYQVNLGNDSVSKKMILLK